jgi:hypothetical protein
MSITYEKYTFTEKEMHAVVQKQREESERVARLGEAAFDQMDIDEFLGFDLGKTLAIMDYYNLVYLPAAKLASKKSV